MRLLPLKPGGFSYRSWARRGLSGSVDRSATSAEASAASATVAEPAEGSAAVACGWPLPLKPGGFSYRS